MSLDEEVAASRPRIESRDLSYLKFRALNRVYYVAAFLLTALVLLRASLDDGVGAGSTIRLRVIRFVVHISTLAELHMWLGHFWLPKPARRLPMWTVWSERVGRFLDSRRWLTVLVTLLTFGLLLVATTQSLWALLILDRTPSSAPVLDGACFAILLFACTLDGWRLLYTHYWLASLFVLSNCESDSDVAFLCVGLAMIFSALYAWTGFFKLSCNLFYQSTAHVVFEPVARWVVEPLVRRVWVREKNPNKQTTVVRAFVQWGAGVGVMLEMLMGVVLIVSSSISLNYYVCIFNLAMHTYICLGIGLYNRIETFVCWNAMCTLLTTLVFHDQTLWMMLGSAGQWTASQWLCLLLVGAAMHLPPILEVLNIFTQTPTLCHMWFVPGASGRNTLLFPLSAYHRTDRDPIPKHDNGCKIVAFRDDTFATFCEETEGKARGVAQLLGLDREAPLVAISPFDEDRYRAELKKLTVSLDGEWVDFAFRYCAWDREIDRCNENFGAGPVGFWRTIQRRIIRAPTLLLVEGNDTWLRKGKNTVCLL